MRWPSQGQSTPSRECPLIVTVKDLHKAYDRPVLHIPSFELAAGQQLALRGASGSGKTTFLHILAGLIRADRGEVWLDGQELGKLSESARDRHRARTLGYVFQSFHLLPGLTALENVLTGMAFGPGPNPTRARELLRRLGLESHLHHRPRQLSVGQQQRVALARALANKPKVLLADEPTGNLDPDRTQEALREIRQCCRDEGAALLLVSHDPAVLGTFEERQDLQDLNRC